MPLLLTAHPAHDADRRLILRVGQEARVGSSEWVELSIPDDAALSPEHFIVRCGADAVVEVLGEQETLTVRGDALGRFSLSDRGEKETEFTAGQTAFSVCWSPEMVTAATEQVASSEETSDAPHDDQARIASIAEVMSLSEAAAEMIQSPDQMLDYLHRLIDASRSDDAIRFLAGGLPAHMAIDWAIQVTEFAEQADDSLDQSILAWAVSGDETDRRRVRDQLAKSSPDNITRWIAQAIILSGGSLGPDNQPPIPPPAHLSGIAILTVHRWSVAAQPDRDTAMTVWLESGRVLLNAHETQIKEASDAACR